MSKKDTIFIRKPSIDQIEYEFYCFLERENIEAMYITSTTITKKEDRFCYYKITCEYTLLCLSDTIIDLSRKLELGFYDKYKLHITVEFIPVKRHKIIGLGYRLKTQRTKKKVSQIQVANEIGIHPDRYVGYEEQDIDANSMIIRNLSKYFHVTTDYLLGLSNESMPKYKIEENTESNLLAKRIEIQRMKKGISQRQVSLDLYMECSQYRNYETGKVVPRTFIVIKLARYFHVTTDYLLGLSNSE